IYANLELTGKAEDTRAFLASIVQPDPAKWNKETASKRIVELLNRPGEKVELPSGPTIIDVLGTALANARESSRVARKEEKDAKSLAGGAKQQYSSYVVTGSGTVEELD